MSEKLSYIVGRQIGYLWPEEINEVKRIAITSVPKFPFVVVIGAGSGTFTLSVAEEREDARIISIDILDCTAERGNMDLAGYGKQLNQVIGDSKIVHGIIINPVDWLLIDGDHTYEGVLADIDNYVHKVKKGGLVSFHDYRADFWPGVVKAVDERMRDYELLSFVKSMRTYKV